MTIFTQFRRWGDQSAQRGKRRPERVTGNASTRTRNAECTLPAERAAGGPPIRTRSGDERANQSAQRGTRGWGARRSDRAEDADQNTPRRTCPVPVLRGCHRARMAHPSAELPQNPLYPPLCTYLPIFLLIGGVLRSGAGRSVKLSDLTPPPIRGKVLPLCAGTHVVSLWRILANLRHSIFKRKKNTVKKEHKRNPQRTPRQTMPPFNKKQLRTPRTHLAHGPSVDSDNQLRHSFQGIRNERPPR